MHWRIKGLAQKVLAVVPGGFQLNDLLQRTMGEVRDFPAHIRMKVLSDWVVQANLLREVGAALAGQRYLEIGTGWFPAFPACFHLAGGASCTTFDLFRHLDAKRTLQMVSVLGPLLPNIAEASGRPLDQVQADYHELLGATTAEDVLSRAHIAYHAPGDAAATGLPANSIDVIFSNGVLAHIPRPGLQAIMREAQRVLRPGGHAVHSIGCFDLFALFDQSITRINFLTYPERTWAFWNNDLLYQNRLRPCDFIALAQEAGLELVVRKSKPSEALLAALPKLPIAPEFRDYPPEELCTTSIDFVVRKP